MLHESGKVVDTAGAAMALLAQGVQQSQGDDYLEVPEQRL